MDSSSEGSQDDSKERSEEEGSEEEGSKEEGSEEEGSEESWKPVGEDDKGLRMERLDGKISCQLTHKG